MKDRIVELIDNIIDELTPNEMDECVGQIKGWMIELKRQIQALTDDEPCEHENIDTKALSSIIVHGLSKVNCTIVSNKDRYMDEKCFEKIEKLIIGYLKGSQK